MYRVILLAVAALEAAQAGGGVAIGKAPQLRQVTGSFASLPKDLPLRQIMSQARPRSSMDGQFSKPYTPEFGSGAAATVSQYRVPASSKNLFESAISGAQPRLSMNEARPRNSFDGMYAKSYAPEFGAGSAPSLSGSQSPISASASSKSIFDNAVSAPPPRSSFSGEARPRNSFDGQYSKAYAPQFGQKPAAPAFSSDSRSVSSSSVTPISTIFDSAVSAPPPRASFSGQARPRASFDGQYSKSFAPQFGEAPRASFNGASPRASFDGTYQSAYAAPTPRSSFSGQAKPRASFDGQYSKSFAPQFGEAPRASFNGASGARAVPSSSQSWMPDSRSVSAQPRSSFSGQAKPRASFDGQYSKSYAPEFGVAPRLSAEEQSSNYAVPAVLALISFMLVPIGVKKFRSSSTPTQTFYQPFMDA